MMHSFLMIGQSNMAGRGYLKDTFLIADEQINVLRNGRWQMMFEPVNVDQPTAGVGLASSFAAAWRLDHPERPIGLIPAAAGSTGLDDWAPGSPLFDHALAMAGLARRSSEIKGILWHQGENDCSPEKAEVYETKLKEIMDTLRQHLAIPQVPLILGGLGDFLTKGLYGSYFSLYPRVNQALRSYTQNNPNAYFVSSEGLSANQDQLHFNAGSQRILGIRYYEAYKNRRDVLSPSPSEDTVLEAIRLAPRSRNTRLKLLERDFATGEISQQQFMEKLAFLKQ